MRSRNSSCLRIAAILLITGSSLFANDPTTYRYEAEDGTLTATRIDSTLPGFSGKGYVTDFSKPDSKVTWQVPVPEGFYKVMVRYRAEQQKGFDLIINGIGYSGTFPPSTTFATTRAATVKLPAGPSTFSIVKGWGYYDIDYLELIPTRAPPPPAPIPDTLVDDQATPATRALMHRLVDLYGKKTLSGVYNEADAQSVQEIAGQTPAILAGDLMDYSPSRIAHGTKPEGQVEELIKQARQGAVLSVIWHWNAPDHLIDATYVAPGGDKIEAPWFRGFYTNATTFDVEKALADPQSKEGQLLLSDIDAIAVQLQKLSDADVPILWRPLHEAEGGWFWWGAKGPKPFVQLWHLLYDRLVNVHHLHNLIWVYTGGPNPDWYPGDHYVDIVGVDAYPNDRRDPLSGIWEDDQQAYGGRKMVALPEFVSVPDIGRMTQAGVHFSFFLTWYHPYDPKFLTKEELAKVYQLPEVVNRSTKAGSP